MECAIWRAWDAASYVSQLHVRLMRLIAAENPDSSRLFRFRMSLQLLPFDVFEWFGFKMALK